MHYQKMVLCADEKTKQTHTGFLHLIITKLNLSFSQAQDRNTSGRPPLEWQTAHTCASHLHVGGQPCGPFPGAGRRTHRRRLGEPLGKYLVVLELCRAPHPPGGGGWPGGLLSLCGRTLPGFVGDLRPQLGQLCAPSPAFPGQGPSLSLCQPCPNRPVSGIQSGCRSHPEVGREGSCLSIRSGSRAGAPWGPRQPGSPGRVRTHSEDGRVGQGSRAVARVNTEPPPPPPVVIFPHLAKR